MDSSIIGIREPKHAYLIMAHKVDQVLVTLLKMLDSFSNDIYIHYDLKSKDDISQCLNGLIKYSKLTYVRRIKVYWGHISQCKAMYELWEASYNKGPYDYYHLISGSDLPIKNKSDIINFFNDRRGVNFVGFSKNTMPHKYNLHYIHPKYNGMRWLQDILQRLESGLGLKNKLFDKYTLQRGCNWSSLTNEAVRTILEKKDEFLSALRYTNCPDECITQTILYNSNLRNTIYDYDDEFKSCIRLIDWNRGNPYIFKLEDIGEIQTSDMIFCRKISDKNLANKIYETFGD